MPDSLLVTVQLQMFPRQFLNDHFNRRFCRILDSTQSCFLGIVSDHNLPEEDVSELVRKESYETMSLQRKLPSNLNITKLQYFSLETQTFFRYLILHFHASGSSESPN